MSTPEPHFHIELSDHLLPYRSEVMYANPIEAILNAAKERKNDPSEEIKAVVLAAVTSVVMSVGTQREFFYDLTQDILQRFDIGVEQDEDSRRWIWQDFTPDCPRFDDGYAVQHEGWRFEVDASNVPHLLHDEDQDTFESHEQALDFVLGKAEDGSPYHQAAIEYLRKYGAPYQRDAIERALTDEKPVAKPLHFFGRRNWAAK